MGVPPAAKSLQSLGNTCSRSTKCTGHKFTSQPESHKHRVTLPVIAYCCDSTVLDIESFNE